MKRILVFVLLFSLKINAQNIKLGLELGPSASLSNDKVVLIDPGVNFITKSLRIGARAGIPVQIKLSERNKINSGIYYAMKGNTGEKNNNFAASISYSSVEIPVIFTFSKFDNTRNCFFFGIGPYLGVGVSGKVRSYQSKKSVVWGYENTAADMQRLEYGAQLQAGIEFKNRLFCRLSAQHCINNLAADEKTLFTNNPFYKFYRISNIVYTSFTVGYYFTK